MASQVLWIGVLAALLAAASAQAQPSRDAPGEGGELPLVPWAHPPQAPELPPEPSSGGGFIGAGALFLTFGTLTTSAVAACHSNMGEWSGSCVGGVLGAGLGMFALGGSLLTVGIVKSNRYHRWKKQHLPPRRPRIVLAPTAGGGFLLVGGTF